MIHKQDFFMVPNKHEYISYNLYTVSYEINPIPSQKKALNENRNLLLKGLRSVHTLRYLLYVAVC